MDDDHAAPTLRRKSSRGRSLQAISPKEDETSLTSFEPFTSSPVRSSNGHDRTASHESCSSSKRSRSIYAPFHQDSTDGEHFAGPDSPDTAVTDATPITTRPTTTREASKAAQALMKTMMESEGPEDSLFNEHDMLYFRQHPSAMANIDNATLRSLSRTTSYFDMIRTLAGDLAQRDAEMVALRRRIEELGKVFKDHLCHAHDLTRLDADRTVQSLTEGARFAADHSMEQSLEDAAETIFHERADDAFGITVEAEPPAPEPETIRPKSSGTVKGVLSMFGGRNTVKASKTNKKRAAVQPEPVPPVPPLPSRSRKQSTVSTESTSLPVTPGPVEMNAIVETQDLPPPLISQRDVRFQYPDFTADVYGFVIDHTRVNRFLEENRMGSPQPSQRGTDTPMTSASSVRSLQQDSEAESETVETASIDSSSWVSYLKFDASSLGSLSWLPIASASGPSVDSDDEDLEELEHSEAVKVLQQQLADDFARLQKSRLIPWEKFLSRDRRPSDNTSYLASMFRRSTPNPRSATQVDLAPSLSNLPASQRAERVRLVIAGIPMSLRAQVYTSIALETLQPTPDEYASLVTASQTSVDPALRAEIEDDVPRTLPNNVFFRPVPGGPEPRGRTALRELLLAFLARRPEIGYCQGMNLIAGYLLLAMPSTEDAFWVFVYLIEHPLADTYFDATLRGASIEICVLRSFLDELVPKLGRKLAGEGVEPRESAPYNWFLTAFASALSVEAVFRVWDVLLGLPPPVGARSSTGFLIRLGVGLCKAFEEEMLALESGFEVRGFMDRMAVGGVKSVHRKGKPGIGIDGLLRASWKLGSVIRDDEIRRRRKFFALRVDEAALI